MHKLYIGCNNATKKLERAKAERIISQHIRAFTAYTALGYWQGKAEKSLIVEIDGERSATVRKIVKQLKIELKQDAIAVSHQSSSFSLV